MATETSEQINEIVAALAKAQSAIKPPQKTREAKVEMKSGGTYKYAYADLSDVIACAREPLAAAGLVAFQQILERDQGSVVLRTVLAHQSGQWIASTLGVPKSARPQDFGSAITYARRYALCALLGIAAEEDDDAQVASDGAERRWERERERAAARKDAPAARVTPQGQASAAPTVKPAATDALTAAKRALVEAGKKTGWTVEQIAELIAAWFDLPEGQSATIEQLADFRKTVATMSPKEAAELIIANARPAALAPTPAPAPADSATGVAREPAPDWKVPGPLGAAAEPGEKPAAYVPPTEFPGGGKYRKGGAA
jgi:hypothetical protein